MIMASDFGYVAVVNALLQHSAQVDVQDKVSTTLVVMQPKLHCVPLEMAMRCVFLSVPNDGL